VQGVEPENVKNASVTLTVRHTYVTVLAALFSHRINNYELRGIDPSCDLRKHGGCRTVDPHNPHLTCKITLQQKLHEIQEVPLRLRFETVRTKLLGTADTPRAYIWDVYTLKPHINFR
jgi:hypothetical protein